VSKSIIDQDKAARTLSLFWDKIIPHRKKNINYILGLKNKLWVKPKLYKFEHKYFFTKSSTFQPKTT
jgi:hypothetical protein